MFNKLDRARTGMCELACTLRAHFDVEDVAGLLLGTGVGVLVEAEGRAETVRCLRGYLATLEEQIPSQS